MRIQEKFFLVAQFQQQKYIFLKNDGIVRIVFGSVYPAGRIMGNEYGRFYSLSYSLSSSSSSFFFF